MRRRYGRITIILAEKMSFIHCIFLEMRKFLYPPRVKLGAFWKIRFFEVSWSRCRYLLYNSKWAPTCFDHFYLYALHAPFLGAYLIALLLRPYIYGHFPSQDWYSGDAYTARMRGSMLDPRCDRCTLFLLSRSARVQMRA